jgi:imidazoleglycerol phosphate dehydratase HisB
MGQVLDHVQKCNGMKPGLVHIDLVNRSAYKVNSQVLRNLSCGLGRLYTKFLKTFWEHLQKVSPITSHIKNPSGMERL